MLPENIYDMTKEATPIFTDTDQLHFEGSFRSGTWKINIIPDQLFYTLTHPNGKVTEGSLPALLSTTVEHDPTYPDVNLWLKGVIDSVMDTYGSTASFQTEKFNIDGRQYSISFQELGQVNLHFPETFIVCSRSNLSDYFPEVLSIKQGSLSDLIFTILADSTVVPGDGDSPQEGLPQYFDRVNYYQIHGWSIAIGYHPVSEVFFFSFDARVVKTHISAIGLDAPEYLVLNDGEYKKVVDGILAEHGIQVL